MIVSEERGPSEVASQLARFRSLSPPETVTLGGVALRVRVVRGPAVGRSEWGLVLPDLVPASRFPLPATRLVHVSLITYEDTASDRESASIRVLQKEPFLWKSPKFASS